MKKPELKMKLVSAAFIALMLCSLFASAVTAENVSENLNDNSILNETELFVAYFIENDNGNKSKNFANTVETASKKQKLVLHQEVGDAIYRPFALPIMRSFEEHAGIYCYYEGGDPNDPESHLIIHQQKRTSMATLGDYIKGEKYLGPYTVSGGLDKETRWKIVNTAFNLEKAKIPFVYFKNGEFGSEPLVPDWSDNRWAGTVDDIARIRCDGLVEYTYEKNGVNVQEGSINHVVERVNPWWIYCPKDYPYSYGFYCYVNQELISHYGIYHIAPSTQRKSLVRSIWEPPTKVKIIKAELDLSTGIVEIEWEKATDKSSGLWGYYYAFDTCPDRELLRWHEWRNWRNYYKSPKETSYIGFMEKGKDYWFHIRSVDKAGNMAETTPVGPFHIINCTNDSDCGKCEKCEEGKCIRKKPCCGNHVCEKGESEANCRQDCPPGPGNDHPDETHDVSTFAITSASQNSSTTPEVAILYTGFATSTASLLENLKEPATLLYLDDFSPDILEDYPILVIPAGGLYGLDSLPSFKSNLEQYVKNGGTLIVFSQQHGYEFDAVPGNLSGYGWTEDQSCHHRSVGISTYHSILSGQDSVTSDVTVDGYFTKYPENTTILLSRTKNGMPAMLMYDYSNGTVIASTIYTDWAFTHHQATRDGKTLVRDMLAWAKDRTEISEYGRSDTVNIQINRTIAKPDHFSEYTEYELGDVVDVPINITNPFNVTINKVSFSVYDPDMETDYVNVSTTIPPNETRIVDFIYGDTDKEGFYLVLYSLCIDETCTETEGSAYFFGINIALSPWYRINYTLLDSDKNIITNESVLYEENVSVTELPTNVSILNYSYSNPLKLGIWRLDYEVYDVNGIVIESGVKKFAVSKYVENPEGWVYQGKKITFSVTTPEEKYPYGSDVPFTIHIWNKGDTDRNISFRTYYKDWMLRTKLSEQNVKGHLDVPAGGDASFTHILHVGDAYFSHNQLIIYASFSEEGNNLGRTEKVVYLFRPSVSVDVETARKEYAKGEDVYVLLNLTNKRSAACNATVTVKTLDPDNKKIYEDSFNINLNASSSKNKTLNFSLPIDASYGVYLVTAEAYSNGRKIGSGSTYFEVSKAYFAELSFDKQDKVYKVRQSMIVYLNITNVGAALWNSTVNTSILDLAFEDSKYVALGPYGTKNISYDLNTENVTAGKHDVIVTIEMDNSTVKDCFFIPESNLVLSIGKINYNAGDNLSINISNTGGVDTTFINCSIKFSDKTGFVIYENETQGNISAGENATISFGIPEQAVSGDYQLIVSCKDNKTGKIAKLSKSCEVSGLKAIVTSVTDKKAYFCDENVTILTNITNLDGAIVNGTLNLKIYSKSKQVKPKDKAMAFDSDQLVDGIVTNESTGVLNVTPTEGNVTELNLNASTADEEGIIFSGTMDIQPKDKEIIEQKIRLVSCQPCNVARDIKYVLHNQPWRIEYEDLQQRMSG